MTSIIGPMPGGTKWSSIKGSLSAAASNKRASSRRPSSARLLIRIGSATSSRTRASSFRSTLSCEIIGAMSIKGSFERVTGLRFFGKDDEPRRVRAHEYARRRRVTTHFRDLEAHVVQHPPELVQRIEPNGVVELACAPILEDHHPLYPEAARDEVNSHFVHADAPVALEPNEARLPLRHEIAGGHVEQKHSPRAERAVDLLRHELVLLVVEVAEARRPAV